MVSIRGLNRKMDRACHALPILPLSPRILTRSFYNFLQILSFSQYSTTFYNFLKYLPLFNYDHSRSHFYAHYFPSCCHQLVPVGMVRYSRLLPLDVCIVDARCYKPICIVSFRLCAYRLIFYATSTTCEAIPTYILVPGIFQ